MFDMAVSADHSSTERIIIHNYCAQHTQEIDGCDGKPVYNAIIEASMTSKLTLIGIVEILAIGDQYFSRDDLL